MKRVYKYKKKISRWWDVNIGDVLILKGKDGTIFDTVIMKENNTKTMCGRCPLSKNGSPGECMHYAFSCTVNMKAKSIDKVMENI